MDGKSFPVVGDLMGNGGIGSEGGEDDDMMIMILSRLRARACVRVVLRARSFGKGCYFPNSQTLHV
jgi:hypothetical protein